MQELGQGGHELPYNVDEGKGFESIQLCKKTYSESIEAIGSSERRDIVMVIRELPGEELENLWPFELCDLEKVIEK